MNLGTLRQNLKETLDAALPGVNIYGWQTRPQTLPAAVLVTADPAIDRNGPVSAGLPWAVHYRVQLIAGKGSASGVEKQIDDLVTRTVLALDELADSDEHRITIDEVTMPLLNDETGETGAQIELTIAIDMKES